MLEVIVVQVSWRQFFLNAWLKEGIICMLYTFPIRDMGNILSIVKLYIGEINNIIRAYNKFVVILNSK